MFVQLIAGCTAHRPELVIQPTPVRNLLRLPTDNAPQDNASGGGLALHAALNETIGFRMTLTARKASVRDPRLVVSDLVAEDDVISTGAIRVYRMREVYDRNYPGWHMRSIPPRARDPRPLDVLVPIEVRGDGWPSKLRVGDQYDFWVDITIPKASSPGRYDTSFTFFNGKQELARLGVSVGVWPFSLPDDPIPVLVELDAGALAAHHGLRTIDSPEGNALLASTVRQLRRHGVIPTIPEAAPVAKVGTDAAVDLEWDEYTAIVAPIVDGTMFPDRRPLPFWPLPVHGLFPGGGVNTSPVARFRLPWKKDYLAACAEYFDQKGWLTKSFAVLPMGSGTRTDISSVVDVASLIREADPRIPIAVPWFPQDVAPCGWAGYTVPPFAPYADIWITPAQFFDADVMTGQRSLGRSTWLAPDRPPFSGCVALHADESTVRVLARQAAHLGAQGIYLGSVNNWPENASENSPADCVRADSHVLLYPGSPFGLAEPIESIRLKYLRRSIQDVAYHVLLERHGLEHVSRTVYDALIPFAGTEAYHTHFADGRAWGWSRDPNVYELARQIMARELVEGIRKDAEEQDDSEQVRNTLWRQLMTDTRHLDSEVEGVRIRPRPDEGAFEAEILLSFSNGRRLPVSGCVSGEAVSEDWTYTNKRGCFSNLAPGSITPARARWLVPQISCGPDGHMPIPLGLDIEGENIRETAALLSWVVAHPTPTRLTIDGDLRDWPPGTDNVAGGFQLISATTPTTGRDVEVPQSQTLGFVTRDESSLYIAVRCESRASGTRRIASKNSVEYDDMIPMGEELIEVLIDPLNTGSRSPDDLYHIVVKEGGVNFAEKGVRLDSPCGRPQPWVSDMEVASTTRSDHWAVELRIPFSAFEYAEPAAGVWGFNITRFDRAHTEFSTWSGAKRNAYDPASLGNLYFPRDRDEEAVRADDRR